MAIRTGRSHFGASVDAASVAGEPIIQSAAASATHEMTINGGVASSLKSRTVMR